MVDVDDGYIEPVMGKQIKRLVQIANECHHVRAQRFESQTQIVRKKPFVLDDQDATAGKRLLVGYWGWAAQAKHTGSCVTVQK